MKRFLIALVCFVSISFSVHGEYIDEVLIDTKDVLLNTVIDPQISSIGGEWSVLGLKRGGFDQCDGFFGRYYGNAIDFLKENNGIISNRKYTEYARVALAFTALGKNAVNADGYDVISPLYNYESVVRQGLNGAFWALIALNSRNYGDYDIKEDYIHYISERQMADGGWAMSKTDEASDPDVTAMALTALSGCLKNNDLSEVLERGINRLSEIQCPDGGFSTYGDETAESTAQVIVALCSLGISPDDERFCKNGITPVDNLLKYYRQGEGFSHTLGGGFNLMATEQAFYALVALKRFETNCNSLFDMTDVPRSFSDTAYDENSDEINKLAEIGIINGVNDYEFLPQKTVTRAEFATIIVKALDLSLKGEMPFIDIKQEDWFCKYVTGAYNRQIIFGISENEFDPNGEITYEQALSMIKRALLSENIGGLTENIDDIVLNAGNISDWARDSMVFCIKNGIAENIKIDAKKCLTRSEIAKLIYNMLKKAGRI